MQISKMLGNLDKILTVLKIIPFELVERVSVNYDKNTCDGPWTC